MEERNIGFEIKTISNLLKRKIDNEIGENESVTGNHGYVLGFLYHNKDRDIFQKDIEQEFSIRRSTATGILNIMESNNLIKRVSSKQDARLKKIVITEKGLKIQQETLKKIEKLEEKLKEDINQQELNNFFQTLDKIKNNI